MPTITIATGTMANVLSTVGSLSSQPEFEYFVAIAAGIPLAFYIYHKLIGLIPSRSGRK